MKRILIAIFAAVVAFSATAQELNVATFNIRTSRPLRPGENRPKRGDYSKFNGWDDRKQQLCDMVNFEAFDIFGIQEANLPQIEDMLERMPDYRYIGVGRDNGADKGEHCAILYRKAKFKVLDQGNFWLSETPDVPSYGWGAKYRRICTWGLFQDKKTKNLFYFVNTHVNWGKASPKSANMIVEFIKSKCTESSNVIITGDFNAPQASELYKIFTTNGFEDTYETAKYRFAPTGTGSSFSPSRHTERRIDHIFVSVGITASRYGVLTYHYYRDKKAKEEAMDTLAPKEIKGENREAKCLSDHYAVQSFVTLKQSPKVSKKSKK